MSPFRFYITDADDGSVQGTNDEQTAKGYAESEQYFVVDAPMGMWLQPDNNQEEVQEIKDLGPQD